MKRIKSDWDGNIIAQAQVKNKRISNLYLSPKLPIDIGLLIYLVMEKITLPEWLMGIIWFLYVCYCFYIIALWIQDDYVKPDQF